jgi:hypothetical protein
VLLHTSAFNLELADCQLSMRLCLKQAVARQVLQLTACILSLVYPLGFERLAHGILIGGAVTSPLVDACRRKWQTCTGVSKRALSMAHPGPLSAKSKTVPYYTPLHSTKMVFDHIC